MKHRKILVAVSLFVLVVSLGVSAGAQRRHSPGRYDRGRYSRPAAYFPRNYNRGNVYVRPVIIPRGHISLSFGGNPYYYNRGNFYRPYRNSISIVIPPVGIRIGTLPYGYRRVYVGQDLFYFYNGTYYRQYDDRQYTVVDAPLGAQLSSLPSGSKAVVVNGEKFYELSGTYYKEDMGINGSVVYTVVGKHGEINNTEGDIIVSDPPPSNVGDVVPALPEGCKTVVVNGQKLFVSPDDTYYAEKLSGKEVQYKIVGKGSGSVSR